MFRLQDNVPEVYVKQSRDFQLFCRIYDMINNSLRFNALSANNLLDPLKVSDRMLPLLATRVGFFPKHDYNSYALREVISAFPYIVKYKGSKQGIEMALNVILKIENNYGKSLVILHPKESYVEILTSSKIQGEELLRDVLSYILPIGYDLTVSTFVGKEFDDKDSPVQLGINITQDNTGPKNTKDLSIIITGELSDSVANNAIGSYTTTQTVYADDYNQLNQENNNG